MVFGKDMVGELVLSLIICGPILVLTSYVFFRDWFLGVQVHRDDDRMKYIVAKRFVAKFESDVLDTTA